MCLSAFENFPADKLNCQENDTLAKQQHAPAFSGPLFMHEHFAVSLGQVSVIKKLFLAALLITRMLTSVAGGAQSFAVWTSQTFCNGRGSSSLLFAAFPKRADRCATTKHHYVPPSNKKSP